MKKKAVVYCVTGSHIQLAAVSIASIVNTYEGNEPLDILVVVNELGNEEILKLKSISRLYEYNYQKDDHWLFDWAKNVNPLKFLKIEKARKNIKIRHFVEFEKNSMPWEHLSIQDKWEKDFWNYLYEIKSTSLRSGKQ